MILWYRSITLERNIIVRLNPIYLMSQLPPEREKLVNYVRDIYGFEERHRVIQSLVGREKYQEGILGARRQIEGFAIHHGIALPEWF